MRRSFESLLIILLALPAHALAQRAPEPVRLQYVAFAAPCPSAESFWEQVVSRTPAVRAAEGADAAVFRVMVGPTDAGVEVVVQRVAPDGTIAERSIVGRTCDDTVAAAALVVALAIEEREQERVEAVPDPVEAPREVPEEPAIAPPPPSPAWRTQLGASAELAIGRTPDALFGVSASVGWRQEARDESLVVGPSFRVALSWLHADPVANDGAHARFDWASARVDGCPVSLALARGVFLEPCGVLEAGVVVASGVDIALARTALQPWVTLGASVRLGWRVIDGLGLELGGGFLVPLVRDRFYFADGVTVLQVPVIGCAVDLGASWTFE